MYLWSEIGCRHFREYVFIVMWGYYQKAHSYLFLLCSSNYKSHPRIVNMLCYLEKVQFLKTIVLGMWSSTQTNMVLVRRKKCSRFATNKAVLYKLPQFTRLVSCTEAYLCFPVVLSTFHYQATPNTTCNAVSYGRFAWRF